MTRASSGFIVAYGKFCVLSLHPNGHFAGRLTAGLPSEHFVIAWKRVDLPTFARPTLLGGKVVDLKAFWLRGDYLRYRS